MDKNIIMTAKKKVTSDPFSAKMIKPDNGLPVCKHCKNKNEDLSQLDSLLQENRFQLYCQEIKSLNKKPSHLYHYEILVRMIDENNELVLPGKFMNMFEENQVLHKLDQWVFNETIDWLNLNPSHTDNLFQCSINLSDNSLTSQETLDFLVEKLEQAQFAKEKLAFEITEASAIEHMEETKNYINTLKDRGCTFILDNFSTGLSSFAYIKKLDFDHVKIDGAVVKNLNSDSIDYSKVNTITELGHKLNITIMAKFVENNQILEKLKEIGVDFAQGYEIKKPIPLSDLRSSSSTANLEKEMTSIIMAN